MRAGRARSSLDETVKDPERRLTLGAAGASAQSPVPTQQSSESAEQYVQRLASLGYSGWLIPKKAPRRR